MPTPVVMPQMGESIAEGTIVRWIKKVGESVDRDEPLFEISTDKVDAEIPSPSAGVLVEIKVKEGETVAVNSVVATIGESGTAVSASPSSGAAAASASTQPQPDGQPASGASAEARPGPRSVPAPATTSRRSATQRQAPSTDSRTAIATGPHRRTNGSDGEAPSAEDLRRQKSSPLVR